MCSVFLVDKMLTICGYVMGYWYFKHGMFFMFSVLTNRA